MVFLWCILSWDIVVCFPHWETVGPFSSENYLVCFICVLCCKVFSTLVTVVLSLTVAWSLSSVNPLLRYFPPWSAFRVFLQCELSCVFKAAHLNEGFSTLVTAVWLVSQFEFSGVFKAAHLSE